MSEEGQVHLDMARDPMPEYRRIIGKRSQRPVGVLRAPTAEERDWVRRMAAVAGSTGAPKGVYRYRSHEEANADWERWHVALVDEVPRVPRRRR
jgi:6-phosphogluconolactonase/glucosamine-6-phosphate isomerase/deaminase